MNTTEITLGELLDKLETAASAIAKAHQALNDTGDYESAALDEATTLTERAARLIDTAYNEANK